MKLALAQIFDSPEEPLYGESEKHEAAMVPLNPVLVLVFHPQRLSDLHQLVCDDLGVLM